MAQVDINMLQMSSEDACSMMETIKTETNIHWHKASLVFMITGSFTEIQHARKCLMDELGARIPSLHPEGFVENELHLSSIDVEEASPQAAVNNSEHNDPTSAISKLENNPQPVHTFQRSPNRKQWEIYDQVPPVRLQSPTQASADDRFKASNDKSGQTHCGERNVNFEKVLPGNIKISVYQGDITEERVDAIVNVANERLQHVGGVALAISRKGGRVIDRESNDIIKTRGPVKVGEVVHTSSGNLSCKYVIHAVGPEWWKKGAKNSRKLLRAACLNSLNEAEGMDSIALPAISCGIYGVPKEVCAEVMFDAVEEYSTQLVPQQGFAVTDVRFVNIDDATVKVFREEFVKRYGSSQGAHPKSHSSSDENKGNVSPHLPEEKEVNKRKNRSKGRGRAPPNVSLEPGKNVDSARQFGRGHGERTNRGASSIDRSSSAAGFTASPSASHNHSGSGNGPSATAPHTPLLYSVVATKGKDDKDRTTVTTPKDRKGSLHVNESLLFVSNHRSLARPQNRY